ncbi:MAG: DUF3667 domain-containing protein [Chitinophagaceae bacterium]|jgi:hypothetical protein|nr:DUF3667 domain-containing protein [Chitinophagaceae bacterium]
MKIRPSKLFVPGTMHTCQNCGHVFGGKVCNICGEKVFDRHQLSVGHFLHEVIDFFYHFENKVLRSIWLNIRRPGLITADNLRGVRVPHARPVQLYLVVAVVFYIVVSWTGARDYTPVFGDHHYYSLSAYKPFRWAAPLDRAITGSIDSLWARKGRQLEAEAYAGLLERRNAAGQLYLYARQHTDSLLVPPQQLHTVAFQQMQVYRSTSFASKVTPLSKASVFLAIPLFALLFQLLLFRRVHLYGEALILATHFMVYNLCMYMLYSLFNYGPLHFGLDTRGWLFMPFIAPLFDTAAVGVAGFVFGNPFELIHHVLWTPWLFLAFRRIYQLPWWKNLLISYFACRICYFLLFGVVKKIIIAWAAWLI